MNDPGYIYVLINPSMDGLLKIGKTSRNPEKRAQELSAATGVPTPYYVAYQTGFHDCTWAESLIHKILEDYRVSDAREFFRMPLDLAIHKILMVKEQEVTLEKEEQSYQESLHDIIKLRLSLLDEGLNHFFGKGAYLQDYEAARISFEKSAQLGNASAMTYLAHMYRYGKGVRENKKKALDYMKLAVKSGDDNAWASMAEIFFDEGHFDNAHKCWQKYFSTAESLIAADCVSYVEFCVSTNTIVGYRKRIFPYKQEMLSYCDSLLKSMPKSGENYKKWFQIHKTIRKLSLPDNKRKSFITTLQDLLSN